MRDSSSVVGFVFVRWVRDSMELLDSLCLVGYSSAPCMGIAGSLGLG